jgi:excisionase family DNA binding protein
MKPHEELPAIVNVAQLTAHWQVARQTLYEKIADGTLPAFRVGRRWRFRREDIMAIEAGGR